MLDQWPVGDVVFWGFAALTVGASCVTAFSRQITHAAFALMFAFFGVAGLYVFLGADFLAAVQVMIYVGGILVLLLFGILMTQTIATVHVRRGGRNLIVGSLLSLVTALALIAVMVNTGWHTGAPSSPQPTSATIGTMFMTDFVLPFEVASILLLAALIGAVKMARKDPS